MWIIKYCTRIVKVIMTIGTPKYHIASDPQGTMADGNGFVPSRKLMNAPLTCRPSWDLEAVAVLFASLTVEGSGQAKLHITTSLDGGFGSRANVVHGRELFGMGRSALFRGRASAEVVRARKWRTT
ncbi:predicted protein [Histoplasma capsulatum var. duboisii H88]|uniref:Predicted protein n=1 Tax=Ajellomyces capsulatus (strain H88) TaxID=544711 RepID=F0U506_AJEC8|nr:predicted protein [Histoplasma capsulatum var. duboisii H88]